MICTICYRHCALSEGQIGYCKVRQNQSDENVSLIRGTWTSAAFDPIEKKNLYHYYPGSTFLTIGFSGCNFLCSYCQNWRIITRQSPDYPVTIERIIELLASRLCTGLAFSYSEPTLNWEWVRETAQEVHQVYPEMPLCMYTNGYAEPWVYDLLSEHIRAYAVSVRGSQAAYATVAPGTELRYVLRNLRHLWGRGCHLEIPYVLLPGLYTEQDVREFLIWLVAEMGPDVPVHFLRYLTHHEYHKAPTCEDEIADMVCLAQSLGLRYVYGSNTHRQMQDTYCPRCGRVLIRRNDLGFVTSCLKGRACPECGEEILLAGGVRNDYENALVKEMR